jgi:hypothetical protein
MRRLVPLLKSTDTSYDLREWWPTRFDNVLREIDHLCRACEGSDQIPLFRGHVDRDWFLDCKLVRDILASHYGYNPPYPRPMIFHTKVTDVLLSKFERRWRPSAEVMAKEVSVSLGDGGNPSP